MDDDADADAGVLPRWFPEFLLRVRKARAKTERLCRESRMRLEESAFVLALADAALSGGPLPDRPVLDTGPRGGRHPPGDAGGGATEPTEPATTVLPLPE